MISYLMGEKTKREHVTKGNLEGSTHQGKDHSLHQKKFCKIFYFNFKLYNRNKIISNMVIKHCREIIYIMLYKLLVPRLSRHQKRHEK